MTDLTTLLRLRVLISYLGEKSQFSWWQSDFFSPTAAAFLDPLFPRTRFLSQVEGSGAAARLLHDDRIGVGRVFHLFRLPEDFEQSFHEQLQLQEVVTEYQAILTGKDEALRLLNDLVALPVDAEDTGPVLVGQIDQITDSAVIKRIGQAYLSGFELGTPVFPYLKDVS